MNAPELRRSEPRALSQKYSTIKKTGIRIIADNILDTFNIGSLFRAADALGASEVILTGDCELPYNKQIQKSSMFLSQAVPWSYAKDAVTAVRNVKSVVDQIVAVELTNQAFPHNQIAYKNNVCLILGNESNGISKDVLNLADIHAKINMNGINHSMNVVMSLSVIGFHILSQRG